LPVPPTVLLTTITGTKEGYNTFTRQKRERLRFTTARYSHSNGRTQAQCRVK
jgi:hypothetical protein